MDTQVITADPLAVCPFCEQPTAGALAGCEQPECQAKEIEFEKAFERSADR